MIKLLCIGGEYAGRQVDMRGDFFQVQKLEPLPAITDEYLAKASAVCNVEAEIQTYVCREIAGVVVWVVEGMSDADIARELLRHYKPGQ